MNIQESVFFDQEADNWFLRNKENLLKRNAEHDHCITIINNNIDKSQISSILELGCSNGYRLNLLRQIFPDCKKIVGVDASKLAVNDGKERYGLELYHDSLYKFHYPEQFDLIIINFVLHWIDRNLLYQTIANIDSLLKESNSYLCLGDFYPYFPYKRKYHHHTEHNVYTYKLNYKEFFLASNCYQLIQEQVFKHDSQELDNNNRCCVSLLRKDNYFIEL